MNKIIKLFALFMLGAAALACTPDEPEMPAVDIKAEDLVFGKAFTVIPDPDEPNKIVFTSLIEGYTPLWIDPQGRSQRVSYERRFPFKGEYTVTFGVQTRGGFVYGEPYSFTIAQDNFNYVQSEMWEMLTGGVGQSKTWLLDLDAQGQCKYFAGPLYFYGVDCYWLPDHAAEHGQAPYNEEHDCWDWQADWAGNGSWLFGDTGAADYGEMTFDLIDGAHLKVTHNQIPSLGTNGVQEGLFSFDEEEHTMTTSDARILHDPGRDAIVLFWEQIKVLSLTEDAMQLGVIRDNDPSEGPCLLVYNYISKDYSDNWTPATGPEGPTEPVLPDDWQNQVGQIVQTSVKWTLSTQNPIDWCQLDGTRMNGWNAPEDYPDWLGTPDPAIYENFSMTLDSSAKTAVFETPDGTTLETTYTLDEKGIYTFADPVPTVTVIGWATFHADADNGLRLMQIETNTSGRVTGIWLGAKDPDKDEYIAYHFVPGAGQGGSAEPDPTYTASIFLANDGWWPSGNGDSVSVQPVYENGVEVESTYTLKWALGAVTKPIVFCVDIVGLRSAYPNAVAAVSSIKIDGGDLAFDPAKIVVGDLEDNGNLRIELYNEYGSTAADPAIDINNMAFAEELELTFTLLCEPAWTASIYFTNSSWYPSGNGPSVDLTGNGSYTCEFAVAANTSGAYVFCIDLLKFNRYHPAATAQLERIECDGQEIPFDASKVGYGDMEGNGNLRIEIINEWGQTKNDPPIDVTAINWNEKLTATFSVSGLPE